MLSYVSDLVSKLVQPFASPEQQPHFSERELSLEHEELLEEFANSRPPTSFDTKPICKGLTVLPRPVGKDKAKKLRLMDSSNLLIQLFLLFCQFSCDAFLCMPKL